MNLLRSHWSITFLSLVLALSLATGCKGRKARKILEETRAAQAQAQEALAPRYTPLLYNNAVRLLTQATDATNAGNHDEAIDLAQRAQAQFQQAIAAVDNVKAKFDQLSQQLLDLIDEIESGIETARQEGVVPEDTLTQLQTELEALQARQSEVQTSPITENSENEYLSLIAQAEKLKERSDLAKLAHLKPQAEQANALVESLLQDIERLNAKQYVPDQLAAAQPQIDAFRNAYAGGNWPAVIQSATEVQTLLQGIVAQTQEAAAGEFVARAQEDLTAAMAVQVTDVPEYANLLGQAQTMLAQAKSSLEQKEHTQAFSAAERVITLVQQARDTLAAQVRQMLDSAGASIDQAKQENVERYAPAELAETEAAIKATENALGAGDFVAAYAKGKSARDLAAGLTTAALRGHARMELSDLEARLNKARAEGAEQYGRPAYTEAAAAVAQLRDRFEAGQYQQVIEQAPGQIPKLDQVFARLAEGVQDVIDRGEAAIALAKEAEAEKWVGDMVRQAQQALQEARSLLAQEFYRKAATSAENALATANKAEATTYRLRAEENLRKADATLSLAERADSPRLSPLAFSRAKETYQQAQDLLEAQEFERGWETSVQALEAAETALNHRILTAQEACDSALDAQARIYDQEDIDQALALLNEAKAAQAAQDFERANVVARESRELATQAESFAWRQRSKQLLLQLATLEQLMAEREADVHAPALARRFAVSLAKARVEEIDADWKECYRAGAEARQAAEQAWEEMTRQLEGKIDQLDEIAATIGGIALDDWGRQQKVDFLPTITELRRLTDLRMYVEAFSHAEKALEHGQKLLDEVHRHNLSIRAESIASTLDELHKTGPAKILEGRSNEIRALIDILKNPGEKYDYTALILQADAVEEEMKTFPQQAQDLASQRTTQAYEILQQAEQAGAGKHFPKRLSRAVKDLQWLRNELRAGDYNAIYEHLVRLESEAPELLEDTTVAVAEDEYKQRLSANLTQMQNLIRDFDAIARLNKRMLIAARASETSTEDPTMKSAYQSMQRPITASRLLRAARLLEQNVIQDEPPPSLRGLKNKAVKSFRHFRKAAEGFEVFGNTEAYDIHYRNAAMEGAYEHLKKTLRVNKEIEYIIRQKEKDNRWERLDWELGLWEKRIERLIWQRPRD